jgi:hypothetical protein
MQQHHYPGALPEVGNTIRHIVTCNNEWPGLLSFSAAALQRNARSSLPAFPLPQHYVTGVPRMKLTAELNACLKFPHVAQPKPAKLNELLTGKKEKIDELPHTESPAKLPRWQAPDRS